MGVRQIQKNDRPKKQLGTTKKKAKEPVSRPPEITKEEENYRLLFDFAYHLENKDRAPVAGATQLLREFLRNLKK